MDDNDHRGIGARLGLYHIQEDAPGMVFWHPRGHAVFRVLEDYIRRKMMKLGYREVRTPQLMPNTLWERSGHWEKFGSSMFTVRRADDSLMSLKPMSCPCHVQIFNQGLRSWRELPVRYAEFGACHRDELSGSLHGLMRARAFEQDDAHVLCREKDVYGEVARFASLLAEVYPELGFHDWEVSLSTRPAVRAGSDELWDWAEGELAQAAESCGIPFCMNEGEGAFYGPKLEFALKDRSGRSWQCGTIQLDCVLPGRLAASYVSEDGSKAVPVMIHHAVLGSIGRFLGILLEQYGGRLPFWLSPDQVTVMPVSKDQAGYVREVCSVLQDAGVRAVCDDGTETLSRRIVSAHEAAIPVIAVAGRREAEARTITLRERDGSQSCLPLGAAVSRLAARRG
jgi:threonyl-tRNA synthetase